MDEGIAWVAPCGFDGGVGMLSLPGLVILPRGETAIDGDRQGQVLTALAARGVTLLVSLLADDEWGADEIDDLRAAAGARGIEVVRAPIGDFCAPGPDSDWPQLAGLILPELARGRSIAFCCLAGYGRSGMMAARVLIAAGTPSSAAIAAVRAARPGAIESDDQTAYLLACTP